MTKINFGKTRFPSLLTRCRLLNVNKSIYILMYINDGHNFSVSTDSKEL